MSEIKKRSKDDLLLEINELREKLAEAEETLHAIRSGEVDALVVTGEQGEQIFTLKSAEQPYRTLIEEMNEGAVMLAADDTILYCNQGFACMLKIQLKKMIGTGIEHFILPTDQAVFKEMLAQGRAESSKGEITFIAGDGIPVPAYISLNALQIDGIYTVNLVAMDLTERKQAEEALLRATKELSISNSLLKKEIIARRQAEELIRERADLLDKAHDAIVVHDLEHRIIYWNRGAQRLYGWTEEEAMGKNADELLYKDDGKQLIEPKECVIKKGEWMGELHQVTMDGKEIIVESRWALICNRKDTPKSTLVINTDITEKKKLEEQFLRTQRMESIGTLASGIAHDLNNMLTPIMLSLEILREKFKDEQSQKLLGVIGTSTNRAANLIKQIKSFARGSGSERTFFQMAYLISEINKIIKETFPRYIDIKTDAQKDLWTISGDATQLHQVLMNMCINARDAMPDGGILKLCAQNRIINENDTNINIDARTGPYIVISISDTGCGIPPEIVDRIFEPFFTTKKLGKGTGLGLSTAHMIVKNHGGFIDMHSEIGKGTTFKIYLPASKDRIPEGDESQPELSQGQGELVLAVDDEAQICEITRAALEISGYRVITAENGAEAVALYLQNREEISVVLMDMMMPVMDGPACIRALRDINPEIKIIAVSGLKDKNKFTKDIDPQVHAFLPKPYTSEKLLGILHDVLSAK